MNDTDSIIRKILDGGVLYTISGNNPETLFAEIASHVTLPASVTPDQLYAGLCERESLINTAVGYGIALPHPRLPLVTHAKDERIYVCYLETAVDFGALDGKPVHTLFVLLSADSRSHLRMLSSLSKLLEKELFRDVLKAKPDIDQLIMAIKKHS